MGKNKIDFEVNKPLTTDTFNAIIDMIQPMIDYSNQHRQWFDDNGWCTLSCQVSYQ